MIIMRLRNVLSRLVHSDKQQKNDMYTIPEAARLMGMTRQRLHLLVQQGRVEACRIGRVWMIPGDAVGHISPSPRPSGRPRKTTKR
jgi:excisionase family DNA binding protein